MSSSPLQSVRRPDFWPGRIFPPRPGPVGMRPPLYKNILTSNLFSLQSVTVARSADSTSYVYNVKFAFAQPGGSPLNATITLTNSAITQYAYAGTLQYTVDGFVDSRDDNTYVAAGSVRYQRVSQNHLNLSVRSTFYLHGNSPVLDGNGELDPTDNTWTVRFTRFVAGFDPTSSAMTGNYVFSRQLNAQGQFGAGPANYMTNVLQVVLNGDGTGGAFYGVGNSIAQPNLNIDHMYCLRQVPINYLLAQYQPFQFDSTAGQYVPSTSAPAQIRYAPTSTCTYTVAQWNNGAAGGFWYNRNLDSTISTAPNPIPEYVVADPNRTDYPSACSATARRRCKP